MRCSTGIGANKICRISYFVRWPGAALALPPDPVALLRGLVPRIVFRVEVGAGGRDGRMPEIVPLETQVHLLARHVRPHRVAQPVRRRAGEHRGPAFPLGATRAR